MAKKKATKKAAKKTTKKKAAPKRSSSRSTSSRPAASSSKKCEMTPMCWVASLLVVIGALNWGLVGLFGFNLVTTLFGSGMLTRVVYVLVGLSGLCQLWKLMSKM